MSLRLRLTLLYSLLFAVLIAAFGVLVYLQTSKRLYASVDDTLRLRADRVISESSDPAESAGSITADQSVLDEITSPGVYVEIVKQDGTLVARSARSHRRFRSVRAIVRTTTRRRSRRITRPTASACASCTRTSPSTVRTRLAASSSRARSTPTDAALDRIRIILIGGGVAFLVVANVAAYLVASPALQPLRKATATAAEIETTADFSRRISGAEQPGEVGDLVRTMNELIAKVEQSLDAHRAFLADSSHELRRPLAVLRGNLEVLASGALPPEEREQVIGETEAESRRMSRILSDLLMLSQVDARLILQFQRVDLAALARVAVEHGRQRFPAREFEFVDGAGPIDITADEQRARQLLENLIENAARYSDASSPVTVSVSRNGRFGIAEVRDGGPGMTDEEARHAFERFYRGGRGRRLYGDGSGLGLSIVRHIAEAHGGGIALTSTPAGTVAHVELPLASVT